MANYCSNVLVISGSEVGTFLKLSKGFNPNYPDAKELHGLVEFTLNGLVKVPVSVEKVGFNKENTIPFKKGEDIKSYQTRTKDIVDGYKWQKENWGVPNDAFEVQVTRKDDQAVVLFETRYIPPFEWFEKACKLFPSLNMELVHVEENEGYAGKLTNLKGKVKSEIYQKFDDRKNYNRIVAGY